MLNRANINKHQETLHSLLRMLEYENEILLDLLHEDGLLLMARGLGIERILIGLLASYSDKANLILIIGASTKEIQYVRDQMQEKCLEIPKTITSDCSISERTETYKRGGCMFITSRILVVDLLKKRMPIHLITGIIVWKAHRVVESGQEAFILRLYRQKNKTGFIKALSMSPLSFTFGFCQMGKIMKALFIKKLYLYPRFQIGISSCLSNVKPDVIELHLQLTPAMKQIQLALLDLISVTLQELKLSNSVLNIDEFSTENAISASFENMLKVTLDPIWHQLSIRTRQLVADVKILRLILLQLTHYDSVTFYNLVNSLRSTEKAMQSAGWMLLPATETLFVHSKLRVFGSGKGIPSVISPEINPKWLALSEILSDIRKEVAAVKKMEKCLIVTADDRTEVILREYLESGGETTLSRLFYRTLGPKLGINHPDDDDPPAKKKKSDVSSIPDSKILKWIENAGDKNDKASEAKAIDSRKFEDLLTLIHPLKNYYDPFVMNKILREFRPKYIIMYDLDLSFVRQVEVWQATTPEVSCCVYVMLYKGTTEEQAYLTDIKREKDSFEYLIKEKASMVLPEFIEGRGDDHPDLQRNDNEELGILDNKSTRDAAGASVKENQKIIVDMREFRSDLPAIIHKMGIDIEPATIDVGDYILTPEICVERKSISDLIGSLNSGRMYNQAQKMTRHYRKPIVLIEFDHNKPFHLQGRFILSSDNRSSSKDVMAKLQLLTIHFPNLRILWCPSPYATAELFHMLKTGKADPTTSEAQAASSEFVDVDQYNPQIKDFISKLPGITSKNIFPLLRKVTDFPHLLSLGIDELTEILGHSKNAKELHSSLHTHLKEPTPDVRDGGKGFRRKFGKSTIKKFS